MKVLALTASLLLLYFVVHVKTESCKSDVTECSNTFCLPTSSHIACHGGLCLCDANGMQCSDKTSCMTRLRCHKHDEEPHCLDGGCSCIKSHALPGHEHGHPH